MSNKPKTASLRIEEWTKGRWAIISASQIIYEGKDEQDTRNTLALWTLSEDLHRELKKVLKEVKYCVEDGTLDPVTVTQRFSEANALIQNFPDLSTPKR